MKLLWESFNEKLALFSGTLLALIMFVVCTDIIARYVFNSPILGVTDYVTVAVPLFVFLPMASTEINEGHIRVEVITAQLGPKWQTFLDLIASSIGLVFIGLLAWKNWGFAVSAFQAGEYLPGLTRVRVWPAKFIVCFGAAFFAVQLCINSFRSIRKLTT